MGFSQGAMTVLFTGLRRAAAPRAILAFSGALIAPDSLAAELASRPPVLLVHGEADEVVPAERSRDAEAALRAAGVPVEASYVPHLGHGIDDTGLAMGALALQRAFPHDSGGESDAGDFGAGSAGCSACGNAAASVITALGSRRRTISGGSAALNPQDLRSGRKGAAFCPTADNIYPALVLNADFRPLSYFPLSLWSWQDAVKAVFLDRVSVLSRIRDRGALAQLTDAAAQRDRAEGLHPLGAAAGVHPVQRVPARRLHAASIAASASPAHDLTFDHVIPRSRGGRTTWENVVTACGDCNLRKGSRGCRGSARCSRAARRASRRPGSCRRTGARFRPTTCTKAGATICIGTPSWRADPRQGGGPFRAPANSGAGR